MVSVDIEERHFEKLTSELSAPKWVSSGSTGKKMVEKKQDLLKRTGMPSPNFADAFCMLFAPVDHTFTTLDWDPRSHQLNSERDIPDNNIPDSEMPEPEIIDLIKSDSDQYDVSKKNQGNGRRKRFF